jgi:hypothetical protein
MLFDHPADLPGNLFMLLSMVQSGHCGASSAIRGNHA